MESIIEMSTEKLKKAFESWTNEAKIHNDVYQNLMMKHGISTLTTEVMIEAEGIFDGYSQIIEKLANY